MLTYKEFISETTSHGTGTNTHDITGINREFPELLSKKHKPKLSWKQRRQHRRQKERAGSVSIESGSVGVNEAHNYSVVNRFGGIRYKNIKKAQKVATLDVTKPKVPTHTNNIPRKNLHLSKKDIKKGETAVGYKPLKITQKFKQFRAGVRYVVNNPVAVGRKLIRKGVDSSISSLKKKSKNVSRYTPSSKANTTAPTVTPATTPVTPVSTATQPTPAPVTTPPPVTPPPVTQTRRRTAGSVFTPPVTTPPPPVSTPPVTTPPPVTPVTPPVTPKPTQKPRRTAGSIYNTP
jgi:hypothetical protein